MSTIRTRLAVLAGVMLLGACSSATRSEPALPTAEAVRAALDADAEAAEARNRRTRSAPAHVAVAEYVAALDAIDLSDAPPDFAGALRAHGDAWAALIEPLRLRADERGEMHDLFDRLTSPADPMHERFGLLIDDVWATWTPVEQAAMRAGVTP